MKNIIKKSYINSALRTIDIEVEGLQNLKEQVDVSFSNAINLILSRKGKVVFSGMGKSGLIAKKIAATISSTGTMGVFLHPAEAVHGDLGIIAEDDILIAISYSGESDELIRIIPALRRRNIPTISITGNSQSTLAKHADVSLLARVNREACPLELAPTASTTAALVLGDAIAVCLMEAKGFKEMDFAVFHPGGSLGRRLLQTVEEVLITRQLPVNRQSDTIDSVILEISKGRLGLTVVLDGEDVVVGLVTDGDLRNAIKIHKSKLLGMRVREIMNTKPIFVAKDALINDAELLMKKTGVNSLIVQDEGKLLGVISQRNLKYS